MCDETCKCTSRRARRARASFANALPITITTPRVSVARPASSSARRRQMSPRVLDHGFRDVRVHVSIVAVALATAVVASHGRGMSRGAASHSAAAASRFRKSGAGRRGWKPRPRPEPRRSGGRRQRHTRHARHTRRSRRSRGMRDSAGIPRGLVLRHRVAVEPTRGLGRRGPVQQRIGEFRFRERTDRRHGGGGPVAPGLGVRRRAERLETRASRGGALLHGLLHRVPRTARSGLTTRRVPSRSIPITDPLDRIEKNRGRQLSHIHRPPQRDERSSCHPPRLVARRARAHRATTRDAVKLRRSREARVADGGLPPRRGGG